MRLIAYGCVLELLYLTTLVLPFNLLGWLHVPAQDLGTMTGGTPASALVFLVSAGCLCLFSWRAYEAALRVPPGAATRIAFVFAGVFALTLVWIYPIDALDLFDYAMQGRILGVLGGNPYADVAAQYPTDYFLPSVGWKEFPSVYGPLWIYVEGVIGRAAGDNVLAALLSLKSLAALSSLVCAACIGRLVSRHRRSAAPAAVVLFGWNPLVVLMVGSGHNDVFMMALLLAGLVLADSDRRALGVWVMGMSAAVKLSTAAVVPALAIGHLMQLKPRAFARGLVSAGLAAAATLVVCLMPLWPGWDRFGPWLRHREPLFTASPLGFLHELLLSFDLPGGADLAIWLSYGLIVVFAVHAAWRARNGPRHAIRAAHAALFWIVFVALPWWQPWYLVWLACLAALDDRRSAARLSWVVALAGLVSLFDRFYLTQRWLPVSALEHQAHTLLLVYLPPIAVALAALARGLPVVRALDGWYVRAHGSAAVRSAPTVAETGYVRRGRKLRRALALGSVALLVLACLGAIGDGIAEGIVAYERDTVVFYFPLTAWVAEQLRGADQLPLWTPQVFGGYPIFADGELGLASPIVLLGLLALPAERAFVLLRAFHLCVAALGAYALGRSWKLSPLAAALVGLTFALGSFFPAQIHHENVVRSGVWLPAILAALEQALRSSGRKRLAWTLAASTCLALSGLGLHAQILFINLVVLGAYGLLRGALGPIRGPGSWIGRLRILAVLVPALGALGFSLAAVQLVPFAELVGFSVRGQGIPYPEAASYSLTPYGLVQLLFPFFFRAPGDLQWGLWTHWESYLYVGLAPLVLAAVALVCGRRREIWLWVALAALGLLIALGQYSPLNVDYLLWLTPGLGGLRAPGRWSLVVVLALAMLAGHGLAWLERRARAWGPPPPILRWQLLAIAILPGALAGLLAIVHSALLGAPDGTLGLIREAYLSLPRDTYPIRALSVYHGLLWSTSFDNPRVVMTIGGFVVLAAVLVAWQSLPNRRLRTWRGWAAVLLILAATDLLSFGWQVHPREPLATLAAPQPSALAVQGFMAQTADGPYRVLASPVMNQVAPNRLAPLGLQEVNGYSSLELPRHMDLLRRVFSVDDQLLDLCNVRYLLEPATFGSLEHFGGVDYLSGQALMRAPAGGALGDETFRVPAGFRVRQLKVVSALINATEVPQNAPVAELTLRAGGAGVVARRLLLAGQDSMDWASPAESTPRFVRHQRVQVAGTVYERGAQGREPRELSFATVDLGAPVAPTSIQIRSLLPSGELVIYGVSLVDPAGATRQLFGHRQTKFREVYRDPDIAVLENAGAFPRAFLVSQVRVASEATTSLGVMERQPFNPLDEVVLPTDTPAAVYAGRMIRGRTTDSRLPPDRTPFTSQAARVVEYTPATVVVGVTASTDAFLVLSDSYFPGWRAFVDGQERPVIRGNLLFRVVPVPAGEHQVVFRFEPRTLWIGGGISAVAVLLLLSLVCWARLPPRGVRASPTCNRP